jgi:ATP-dependent helicase Lhr and Lhr-like helicase
MRTPHATLWVTAERLRQFEALWPSATLDPPIAASGADADRAWSPEEAQVEIVRGRLEGLGVVTPQALATSLGLGPDDIAGALVALEVEGFAMRGRFTPGAPSDEWCERRLLARIHAYTVKRLRAEIEPVAARDFVRFLLSWQRVSADARMQGSDALDAVVGQLEGFEAPAGAWETEILPCRLAGYDPAWLDARCLAGHVSWMRLRPRNGRGDPSGKASPVRTTPITLVARRHAGLWGSLPAQGNGVQLGDPAQRVADFIGQHGASFFYELVEGTGLLRTQVEDALAELVAYGLVTSDSFAGLRALLVPSEQRKPYGGGKRRRRTATVGMDDAGRWALARRAVPERNAGPDAIEHLARTLLRRYGVVFWRLIEREADWLPPWRELLRVFRRLESRGEIRGGRFVAGFSGEQFALPDAVGLLRETRRRPASGAFVSISGADPLNLVGILTPGQKLPALTGNRLLYRDGLPIAMLAGGEVQFLQELDPADQWAAHKALLLAEPGPPVVPETSDVSEEPPAADIPFERPGASTPSRRRIPTH